MNNRMTNKQVALSNLRERVRSPEEILCREDAETGSAGWLTRGQASAAIRGLVRDRVLLIGALRGMYGLGPAWDYGNEQ